MRRLAGVTEKRKLHVKWSWCAAPAAIDLCRTLKPPCWHSVGNEGCRHAFVCAGCVFAGKWHACSGPALCDCIAACSNCSIDCNTEAPRLPAACHPSQQRCAPAGPSSRTAVGKTTFGGMPKVSMRQLNSAHGNCWLAAHCKAAGLACMSMYSCTVSRAWLSSSRVAAASTEAFSEACSACSTACECQSQLCMLPGVRASQSSLTTPRPQISRVLSRCLLTLMLKSTAHIPERPACPPAPQAALSMRLPWQCAFQLLQWRHLPAGRQQHYEQIPAAGRGRQPLHRQLNNAIKAQMSLGSGDWHGRGMLVEPCATCAGRGQGAHLCLLQR